MDDQNSKRFNRLLTGSVLEKKSSEKKVVVQQHSSTWRRKNANGRRPWYSQARLLLLQRYDYLNKLILNRFQENTRAKRPQVCGGKNGRKDEDVKTRNDSGDGEFYDSVAGIARAKKGEKNYFCRRTNHHLRFSSSVRSLSARPLGGKKLRLDISSRVTVAYVLTRDETDFSKRVKTFPIRVLSRFRDVFL